MQFGGESTDTTDLASSDSPSSVSIFVLDDEAAVSPVVADYENAIRHPEFRVEAALIILRRAGSQDDVSITASAQHARVIVIVSSLNQSHLEELRALAPGASLKVVSVRGSDQNQSDFPVEDSHIPAHPSSGALSGIEDDIGLGQSWIFLQSDESMYADLEGASYHFLRTTRASGDALKSGDWALCLRASDSRQPDSGGLFGLARIGRVHRKGEARYAVLGFLLESTDGTNLLRTWR